MQAQVVHRQLGKHWTTDALSECGAAVVRQMAHHLLAGQLPFEELQNLGKLVLLVNLSAYYDLVNRAQGVSDHKSSTLPKTSP